MANLKPVLPSLIGRPQTASQDVHPVRMPNVNEALGEGLSSFVGGGVRLASAFGDLARERDEAEFRRNLVDAISEADKRMNDEVFSAQGFSAQGVSEKAAEIYADIGGKYSGKLSGRNAQRFAEAWGNRRNTQVNTVMGFERGQLQRAQVDANTQIVKSEVANYAATLEPTALDSARKAYEDTARIANGGRLVSNETLARFDKDLQDGDDRIKLPDGRAIRIVDEAKPGEKDVITRERLNSLRENMGKQAAAYEAGLQNLFDAAHAQVVERYLKDDRLDAAESYLNSISTEGYPQGVSKAVLTECRDAVARKREVADVAFQTVQAVSQIQSKAGPDSQRYGSPEQDRIFTEVRRRISEQYAGEKWKTGSRIISALEMQYRMLQDQQKANLASDTVSALTEMQKSSMNLQQQENRIMGMKDGLLKTALLKAHARKVESYNNNTDPVFVANQEAQLNAFKLALGAGRATLDGVEYDFGNQEMLKAYILNLGLTDRNQKRAGEYIANSKTRIDATLAAGVLAKLLGNDDPAEALARYPNILMELDARKGTDVIEPSKMNTWLKQNISEILTQKVSNYNAGWWDTSNTLKKYMKGSESTMDDLYADKDQLTEAWRGFQAQQALKRGDRIGAQQALKAVPGPKDLADFASARGYRYERGRYFLRGGK